MIDRARRLTHLGPLHALGHSADRLPEPRGGHLHDLGRVDAHLAQHVHVVGIKIIPLVEIEDDGPRARAPARVTYTARLSVGA